MKTIDLCLYGCHRVIWGEDVSMSGPISWARLGWLSLPFHSFLFSPFHSFTGLHWNFLLVSEWACRHRIHLWFLGAWLVIIIQKSNLVPSSKAQYLRLLVDTIQEMVFLTDSQIVKFQDVADDFFFFSPPPPSSHPPTHPPTPRAMMCQQILGHVACLR